MLHLFSSNGGGGRRSIQDDLCEIWLTMTGLIEFKLGQLVGRTKRIVSVCLCRRIPLKAVAVRPVIFFNASQDSSVIIVTLVYVLKV
jgi:hypothetical protein